MKVILAQIRDASPVLLLVKKLGGVFTATALNSLIALAFRFTESRGVH